MASLRAITEQARREYRIPEVIGERCVHALVEAASCRACVQACPRGAWTLDDETLGIDTENCDGCGLCAPACPEGAIVQGHAIALRQWRGQTLALCACEEAGVESGDDGLIPCVHALGLRDLLALYRKGVRRLVVASGDCDQCPRGKGARLQDRLSDINQSLEADGWPGFNLESPDRVSWQRLRLQADRQAVTAPPLSRRGFLKTLARTGLQEATQRTRPAERDREDCMPPGKLLPSTSAQTRWPFVPMLQERLCRGCDACVRLCPHQAIVLKDVGARECYELYPENCSGCGICVDVCAQHAISLARWRAQDQHRVALQPGKCNVCGVPFHVPVTGQTAKNPHCPICSERNHYKNLFQVLE
jgi:Pyruvate/2-oxoacid:ferredoxin oxidoreductase delta subunit